MGSRALLNLTPEIQQKTRLESSSVKSSMLTQSGKCLVLRRQSSLEYSFPWLGLPLFKAEGQPRAPGFAPSLGRRQREEEEGPTAWVAGAALGTARCQEVRSPSSGRRAGAAPFPAVVCPESEHMLSSQPGHRQTRRCLEKLQPFSLSSLSPSSCRGKGSNHFRAHKPRSHSFNPQAFTPRVTSRGPQSRFSV